MTAEDQYHTAACESSTGVVVHFFSGLDCGAFGGSHLTQYTVRFPIILVHFLGL